MLRGARPALVALGIALGLVAEAVRLAAGWPLTWVVADLIPGIAFLVCGYVAWSRRPDTRIGPLMVAAGFAWYSGTIAASMNPLVDRVGYGLQGWYDGLLAWLVLAYPSGTLRGNPARLVIGAFLAVLGVRTLFRLVAFRTSTEYDMSLPTEIDRYIADLSLRETGDGIFRAVIAALAIAVLVLLLLRVLTEGELSRRIAFPMILAGVALSLGVVVEYGAVSLATTPSDRFAAWDLADLLTVLTAALVPVAFLLGMTRSRLARGAVADLVVGLGSSMERPQVRDVIARAVRDPTLEVLYPVPGTKRYVDADGHERQVPPTGSSGRGVTRLDADGRTLAVLVHDAALAEQPELVRSVAAAARLAIDNERLAAEVRAQLAEVRASRSRIVAAGDEQRRRIERDLHDGAQQRLVTLALRLQMARSQANGIDPALAANLDDASRELELALAELRELARGLHPTVLAEEGLGPAIENLADRSPVPVHVTVPDRRFAAAVESTAYFVVAEALTNVAKYARSTAARVSVDERGGLLTVEVADDGVGGADPQRGSGLRGLEDRVAAVGGRLIVISDPGHGTRITAEIPCASS